MLKKSNSKIIRRLKLQDKENKISGNTIDVLKKAWNDLPPDFTMGERTLFIELAERIVKIADFEDRKVN